MPEMNVLKLNGTEYEIADKKAREILSALDASSSIVCTASGAAIAVADAADRPLQGLKLFGKTVQQTTTGKNLLKTPIAVKYRDFSFADAIFVKAEQPYALSFSVTGATKWRPTFAVFDVAGEIVPGSADLAENANLFTVTRKTDNVEEPIQYFVNGSYYTTTHNYACNQYKFVFHGNYYVVFGIYYGDTTAQTVITNGQLELGEVATPYEPYTGGKPSPSPEYPQELESVGDGGSVGLTVAGKNLCNAKAVVNGVYNTSVNVSDDGYTIISVGGSKAWANADIVVDITALRGKTVYLKIDSAEGTQQYPSGILAIANTTSGTVYLDGVQKSRPKSTFVIPENTTKLTLRISTNNTGTTHEVDNTMTIKGLMLSVGDYAEWETYKPIQTLTASTPNGLPGIPGAAGGDYTDENGQQWICDEIDFARGVYVQRVLQAEVQASNFTSVSGGNAYATIVPAAPNYYTTGLCSHAKIKYSSSPGVGYFGISPNGVLIFGTDKTNLSDFRAWLGSEKIQVLTPTQAAPVETPLSAEELAAYAALHTNKSATTVLNDAGAHMELSYVADTKAYIDNKFAELAAAMVNN